MMNKQTFEEYLMDIHAKQYQGLDDEMPEDFNNWLLEEIGPEEIIDYAEEWHRKSLLSPEEIDHIITKYSTEILNALGDRFITIGGKEELAKAIHKRITL